MCSIQMFVLNWKLALTIMVVIPPLAFISWKFQQKILASYRQVRKTNSQITGAFNEGIMGAKTSKTLVREEMNTQEFKELTSQMQKSSVRAASLSALYLPIVVSLGSLATAYALWKGGYDVFTGAMTLGTIQVFVSYTIQFFQPIRDIARIFAELQSSQAAAERVVTLLETEPDIVDSPEVVAEFGDNFHPKRENWPSLKGDIDFENVSFRYKGGEHVLENFSLSVKAGQTIALVGETGSGKSTLVQLLQRLFEPQSGSILIGGVPINKIDRQHLRSRVGLVLQEPFLFSKTIRENVGIARRDPPQEEIVKAASIASAHSFILESEKGYDTVVGERGVTLSGGQKQRIAIARTLMKESDILIFDDSLSAVDTETDMQIRAALKNRPDKATTIIISHRITTLSEADHILVLDQGRIADQGTHEELCARPGLYQRIYQIQSALEEELTLSQAKVEAEVM
jgi:ATP-binding cassette subfamily B protein